MVKQYIYDTRQPKTPSIKNPPTYDGPRGLPILRPNYIHNIYMRLEAIISRRFPPFLILLKNISKKGWQSKVGGFRIEK